MGENRVKKTLAVKICIAFLILLSITTTSVVNADLTVGVKPGDTMKYGMSYSGTNPESPGRTEWITIEITSVSGATITYRQTDHLFDGTETNRTISETITNGTTGPMQSGLFIPANLKAGDMISTNVGTSQIMIAGETTQTYANANRILVWVKFSLIGIQFTDYWDKQTGILVEAQQVSQNQDSSIQKLIETNLWNADIGIQWLLIVVAVAVVVIVAIALVRRARRSKTQNRTTSTSTRL
jgi:hypothetical protein